MKGCSRFGKLSVLLVCVVLTIGGCGKGGSNGDSGQAAGSGGDIVSETYQQMAYKDTRYLPEFTDMSKKYDAFASSGIGFLDNTFYLIKRQSVKSDDGITSVGDGQLVAFHPDTGEEKILLDETDMGETVLSAAPVKGGAVIVLLRNHDSEYRLYKSDSEGNEIFSKDISLSREPVNSWLLADWEERCYLITREEIRLFDQQGNPTGTIDLSGKSVNQAISSNGTVYLYDYATNQMIPVDFETASLGDSAYTMPNMMMMVFAASEEADFLVCDEMTVYQYSCKEASLTPLFDLQDSQIRKAAGIDIIG